MLDGAADPPECGTPTILTHAVAGVAIGQVLAPCSRRGEITWIAAACAVLPDADVLGFRLGIPYGDLFGYRGFTHSIFFAGVVAFVVTGFLRSKVCRRDLLESFSVRPIMVSPIGLSAFLTKRGWSVLASEMAWVWAPSICVFLPLDSRAAATGGAPQEGATFSQCFAIKSSSSEARIGFEM
jgi:inner membrane protein